MSALCLATSENYITFFGLDSAVDVGLRVPEWPMSRVSSNVSSGLYCELVFRFYIPATLDFVADSSVLETASSHSLIHEETLCGPASKKSKTICGGFVHFEEIRDTPVEQEEVGAGYVAVLRVPASAYQSLHPRWILMLSILPLILIFAILAVVNESDQDAFHWRSSQRSISGNLHQNEYQLLPRVMPHGRLCWYTFRLPG